MIRFIICFFSITLWSMTVFADGQPSPSPAQSINVVVSIPPFHSLVAAIMRGVSTPQLLIQNGASPHHYSLRPSDIKRLQNAHIIFWGGPALETFLVKPLQNLKALPTQSQPQSIVELARIPELLLLPVRQSPSFEPHHHDSRCQHAAEPNNAPVTPDSEPPSPLLGSTTIPLHNHTEIHQGIPIDMHFWLDPHNAIILTDAICNQLKRVDPTHQALYQKNADTLKSELRVLQSRLSEKLKTVRKIPFIVFHDAYQYFENRYGLTSVGAITLHPEIPPSAKRLREIRTTIQNTKARCVFTEPQFPPKLAHRIMQDLNVKVGELDPIGQSIATHSEGYTALLENLSNALIECLQE